MHTAYCYLCSSDFQIARPPFKTETCPECRRKSDVLARRVRELASELEDRDEPAAAEIAERLRDALDAGGWG